jgi:hypothetical protein
MSTYYPDSWAIVKITGTDPHYRVFGSWSGGYLDGDSWKLNSGITDVTETETHYHFKGHSGSEYVCHKESYGVRSIHNIGVLTDLCERSGGNAEYFKDMPDVMNMDWIGLYDNI